MVAVGEEGGDLLFLNAGDEGEGVVSGFVGEEFAFIAGADEEFVVVDEKGEVLGVVLDEGGGDAVGGDAVDGGGGGGGVVGFVGGGHHGHAIVGQGGVIGGERDFLWDGAASDLFFRAAARLRRAWRSGGREGGTTARMA